MQVGIDYILVSSSYCHSGSREDSASTSRSILVADASSSKQVELSVRPSVRSTEQNTCTSSVLAARVTAATTQAASRGLSQCTRTNVVR